ncbi:MAG: tyrosine-type recombinase/integrase [bacterium]
MTKKTQNDLTPRMLQFLEHQSVTCKETSLLTYKVSLKHFVRFLKHNNKNQNISKNQISKLRESNLNDFLCYLNQKKLAAYTRVRYLLDVRVYLAWEVEQKNFNPQLLQVLDRKRLPKVPEYLPRPLNTENDRKLQNLFKNTNSPYALIFQLLRHTGLRISELINLPWDPIITNEKNESYLKVPLGKMDTERLVPLNQETIQLISKIKKAYPINLIGCDRARLIGLKGSVKAVRHHLDYHFKKFTHGFIDQNKPITFHRLRHTYATSLLTGGMGIVSLMKLLGHRRIEMSLRYTKVTPSHLRNEYLKAIKVIEAQAGIKESSKQSCSAVFVHPAEIIKSLRVYINKCAKTDPIKRKNLLRKLNRLIVEFESLSYEQPFKI